MVIREINIKKKIKKPFTVLLLPDQKRKCVTIMSIALEANDTITSISMVTLLSRRHTVELTNYNCMMVIYVKHSCQELQLN